ncbi:MAG TPA: fatty acid desaturase [Thermoanaerobaculia bacterium]|nr:fatty acid desaturase [Thermoanaerobaculia bacterium]
MITVGKPYQDLDLQELSRLRVLPFLSRVLLYLVLLVPAALLALSSAPAPALAGIVLVGLIYAHGVELQHQALHNSAFPSKSWNRFVGFLLGLPMLVSFSDYQHSHLRHHRLLGTRDDREFFNYGYDRLTSLRPLLMHLFMLRHYRDVSRFIAGAAVGRTKPDIKPEAAGKIRTEYQLMALCIVIAAVLSVVFHSTAALRLWLLPLLIAVPAHALIELPEHWGEDHDSLDVRHNTRTISAGWFASWYTNGNNFHIEHHWLPSVPNHRFRELHSRIRDEIEPDAGYGAFYRQFLAELYHNTFSRGPRGGGNLKDTTTA